MGLVNNGVCLDMVDSYNMLILGENNRDDEIQLPPVAYAKLRKFLDIDRIGQCLIYRVKIEIVDAMPTDEEAGDGLIHPNDRRYECVLSMDQPYKEAIGAP